MAYGLIQLIAVFGFLLSLYALYVERKSAKSKTYKPICDINDRVSCTKAFSSKYGRLAVLPNSLYGMFFYPAVFVLAQYEFITYIFYLSILSVLGSLYLAYVMYFKIKTICLVCSGIYLTSILLLIFSYARL